MTERKTMKPQLFIPALSTVFLLSSIAFIKPIAKAGSRLPAEVSTVPGVVQFGGNAPPATRINMAQDPLCRSAQATTEDVVTDGKGHLENVIVYISDGLGSATFPMPTDP